MRLLFAAEQLVRGGFSRACWMPPDQTRPVTPKPRAKRGWKALWSCRVGETPAVDIPAVSGTNRTEQHVILACGGLSPGVCSECLLGWPVFSSYGTTDDLSSPSGCCARAATCPNFCVGVNKEKSYELGCVYRRDDHVLQYLCVSQFADCQINSRNKQQIDNTVLFKCATRSLPPFSPLA